MEIAQHRPSILALAVQPLRNMFVFSGRSTRTEVFAFFALTSLISVPIDGPSASLLGTAKLFLNFLWFFPWIALIVRRLHDQQMSGWWVLTLVFGPAIVWATMALPQSPNPVVTLRAFDLVSHPAATPLAVVLVLAFVAVLLFLIAVIFLQYGTPGPNRYGSDPRV